MFILEPPSKPLLLEGMTGYFHGVFCKIGVQDIRYPISGKNKFVIQIENPP
jgi:hypothetical protein